MRAYAQIVPTFWTRGSGKRLRGKPDAQVLALYLMTAPASNLIGLFYLPMTTLCHETGLTPEQVTAALALPELAEIVSYDADAELVWVPEAARYQIGETMGARDKRRPAVLRELAMAGSHAFVRAFRERYSVPFGLDLGQVEEGVSEAPSEGHPSKRKPPDPDPAPAPVQISDSPEGEAGEPKPDPSVPHPLPADWKPWPTTLGTLEVSNAIPAWAGVEIAKRFVGHFAVDASSRSTAVGWQQRFTRWAAKDWSDPSRRPPKPEPSEAERAAKAAANDAAFAALVARERAERGLTEPRPVEESKNAVAAVLAAARAQSSRGGQA